MRLSEFTIVNRKMIFFLVKKENSDKKSVYEYFEYEK